MGQGAAEAERERELSKRALATRVSALGSRVRGELDWRAKLQRDGLRYAVIGTVAVVVAATVIAIRARRPRKESAEITVTSLDDIAAQLTEIRAELDRRRKDDSPLWQRLAIRTATAAAAGAGGVAARKAMERFDGGEAETLTPGS
jgi:hypothetical protein